MYHLKMETGPWRPVIYFKQTCNPICIVRYKHLVKCGGYAMFIWSCVCVGVIFETPTAKITLSCLWIIPCRHFYSNVPTEAYSHAKMNLPWQHNTACNRQEHNTASERDSGPGLWIFQESSCQSLLQGAVPDNTIPICRSTLCID